MVDPATSSPGHAPARPAVRLAELVAALSLGVDLGFGQPMEHVLRQCVIALRLAERAGLDDDARSVVYYTALLVNVGCHADAYEQAKWFGDDIDLKSHKYEHEPRSIAGVAAALRQVGRGNPPLHRFRVSVEFALSGFRELDGMIEQHAALARSLAAELGLPGPVQQAVGASYEQWDGRGWPGELRGDAVPVASRLAQFAEYVEVAHRIGGTGGAEMLARGRSGTQFDPSLVHLLCGHAEDILGDLDTAQTWDAVIGAEPALGVLLEGEQLDAALLGVANFVDLKSPFTLGHARAVAGYAAAAGHQLGWPDRDVQTVRRAGLVHGLGRLGCRTRSGTSPGRWVRVNGSGCACIPISPSGCCASRPGWPRSAPSRSSSASAWTARGTRTACPAPRSHRRPASSPRLTSTSPCGSRGPTGPHGPRRKPRRSCAPRSRPDGSDADAAEAVLSVAGHASQAARRPEHPAGLTAREVDVLRLAAQGLSSRQIAQRLVISPKTARNHIEHIYVKIGASSRATASLFAMRHGLLPEQEPARP